MAGLSSSVWLLLMQSTIENSFIPQIQRYSLKQMYLTNTTDLSVAGVVDAVDPLHVAW